MGSAELPSELIFEILSRTSLETLERCKAVSKSWKHIIYEPSFLPLHSQRTNSLFGYFFQDVRRIAKFPSAFVSSAPGAAAAAAIKVTWPCDDMEILASCDQGILCCQRRICYNKRFYACKPATSQWQALPNPKLRYETDAVAIVVVRSTPLRYIIARLYHSETMQHHCEIFDSETWAWEKIECAAPYGEIIEYCRRAVTTAGRFFHWLTVNGNVLTLDVKRRSFRCSPLLQCDPACKWKELVEYEGELGFARMVEDGDRREMEVWVGEERKVVVDMRCVERAVKHAQPVEFCSSIVVFTRFFNH
ncbi:F-box protein At5g41720-like [Salvia miltiorrhiza]|uniref:F-box protein At5g41720-like n=1 Tax=Salvia miltiorrhiza TaxID=226208 RepID=UPI0025ACFDBC|nr:F-box protein At5g41720-like [Salvia miltiorrhiza]